MRCGKSCPMFCLASAMKMAHLFKYSSVSLDLASLKAATKILSVNSIFLVSSFRYKAYSLFFNDCVKSISIVLENNFICSATGCQNSLDRALWLFKICNKGDDETKWLVR